MSAIMDSFIFVKIEAALACLFSQKKKKKRKKMAGSKETKMVDLAIKRVLNDAFADEEKVRSKEWACERLYKYLSSDCIYFARLKTFEQAYDKKLAEHQRQFILPIHVPKATFSHQVGYYYALLKCTIMDPKTTCITFKADSAIGTVPPRLYVASVLLCSISIERQFNDGILQVALCGKSSTGRKV